MTLISILLAILLLAILIVVHEAGHFAAARLTGIEVREFSIGMGPKLYSRVGKKRGTVFSVRGIPLGGYCAFYGEDDPDKSAVEDPRAFANQKLWKRMVTIVMGPLMNFVLAFVVATLFYWIGGIPTATGIDPYIVEVMVAGPAYSAGLEAGDVVSEVNGVSVLDGTLDSFLNAIDSWRDGDPPLQFTVLRGEETLSLEMTPVYDEDEKKMRVGITVGGRYRVSDVPVSLGTAIQTSAELCVESSGAILTALKDLVTTGEGLDQTAGPIGIVSLVSEEVRESGFSAWVQLLVLISINLGLMNLLPIPGLDGSRLVFGLIELTRGKPVPPEKEAVVHLIGFVLLFGLMLFFTFKDIMRLFG